MTRVLFVCTGNACRSPMAEAFLNYLAERRDVPARAVSAGLHPYGEGATVEAFIAASELGADLSTHRPQAITEKLVEEADVILTMTRLHAELVLSQFHTAAGKTFPLMEYIGKEGDVRDPFNHALCVYRKCARRLSQAVGMVLQSVRRTAPVEAG
jgi:protein-tyrosine-phosphatase